MQFPHTTTVQGAPRNFLGTYFGDFEGISWREMRLAKGDKLGKDDL